MTAKRIIKLSSNENYYGCSPLALEAIQKKYKDVHLYPEANPVTLKEKLADKFSVSVNNIAVGAGSVGIINGLIQTCVRPGEEVLTFENSFIAYGQLAGIHGRKCIFAPLSNLRCYPENLIPFINNKTRLIFIANPNNPTGTIISHAELEEFLGKIPNDIIVVVDEAYAEYVTDPSFSNSIELRQKYPNMVILHSFSKIYGLAGFRIGYGIMEEHMASKITKAQIPFSLNYLSYTVAIAALSDVDFISRSVRANDEGRRYLYNELKKLGYHTIPSQANYIYMWFEQEEKKKEVYELLLQHGIMICDLMIFGQENALRITIGDQEVNREIITLLYNHLK